MGSVAEGSVSLKLIRTLSCTACHKQFFIKDLILKGSKYPMLLQCGHSVCDFCLQQNLKLTKLIVCQDCGSSFPVESADQVNKCFPLNFYAVGSIVAFQNARYESNKKLAFLTKDNGNFNYAVKAQSNINPKSEPLISVCEECSGTASWYCENCESNFCLVCWIKVHESAKSLMKHSRVPICDAKTSRNYLKKCPEHETQYLEFFCNTCSVTVCSHCVILQHQGEGHCPITLKEKNSEILSKMKAAAEGAEKMKKRMIQTLEKVNLTQNSLTRTRNKVFSELENEISRNFSRIHGILQLEEDRLLKAVNEKSNEFENAVKTVRSQLEKQVEYVEGLLREHDIVAEKTHGSDLTDLYRQLTEVENLPCYLISQKAEDTEPGVTFDEKFIEQIQTYCNLALPSGETFELRSSSDLPEDYAVEPLVTSSLDGNPKQPSKAGQESSASDIDSLSNSSSRDLGKGDVDVPLPKPRNEGKVFEENKSYSVRVCYIKNPGEFYITPNSQRSRQQAIDKRASQYASSISIIPTAVSKDELYLVKYKVDRKWYRARVVEFYPAKERGGEDCVQVYYLDYGNSETVPLHRLRPIPHDMLEPPLAVKCKLYDCVPKNGAWCLESTKTMERILNNYMATMFVMKVHRDCLEVDLSVVYPEGQIGRDIVSVRDALLFLEFSNFVNGPRNSQTGSALSYPRQCLPSTGDKLEVILSHVNSPSDFYVQRKLDAAFLYKLGTDLQNYYEENMEKGYIYNPTIGVPCAALFSSDHKWYRAEIIDVPGKRMVTVFYVDYGNTENVSWTAVRKLKESFVKRPPMALNCTLVGILPADGFWSPQAKAYLEKWVMSRDCRAHVYGRPKAKQRLKVILYRTLNRKEICLNRTFVAKGYAVKNSNGSLSVLKSLGEDEDEEDGKVPEYFTPKPDAEKAASGKDEEGESSDEIKTPLKKGKYFEQNRKKDKLNAKKLRELYEFEKKVSACDDFYEEDTEEEFDEFDNVFKVRVQVLSAESPSCIYVTFPSLSAELKNLEAKLAEFYQNSSPPNEADWKEDSLCVAYDAQKCTWHRALILSVLPDDRVKVFLKDAAKVSTVPTSCLRKLDPAFAKYATCAVKCHLADIAPPAEKWPSVSCEYLISEIECYKKLYITKKGEIENKSLPVELWVKKVVPKGALEPTTKEWITLNRFLVKQGLAVPIRQKMIYSNPPSNDSTSNGMKEPENNMDTEIFSDEKTEQSDAFFPSPIAEWLPPEPFKTSRFVGIPTYVDTNAVIYLHDEEEDGGRIKEIAESLRSEFENGEPSPEDHSWTPGQLCIARYHLDKSWYRGSVLKVNEDLTYDVLFVDYGNVETCQACDLRKKIKMHEIPVLTHKCQLQGIAPASKTGKWTVSDIETLHALVVEKKCHVNVSKLSLDPNEPNIVSLKIIENDVDVKAFLVKKNLAVLNTSESSDLIASDSGTSSRKSPQSSPKPSGLSASPNYIPLRVPPRCGGLYIQVTKVASQDEFFGIITDGDSPSSSLKSVLEEFKILQQTLEEEGPSQPLVERVVKGHPCCCVNTKNKKWCRAEVISFIRHESSAFVIFVDYGNKEFYDKNSLHECKSEWVRLPKMALKFKLGDVQMCSKVQKAAYMKALTNCIANRTLFAEILRRHDDLLEVRLLTKRKGCLVYQEMIDNSLMEFIC